MSYNLINMKGKRILITGASSGIGRETAILLAKMGANVVLISRNKEKLDSAMSLLDGTGHISIQFDLMNLEGIVNLINDIVEKVGQMDGLVHCAGIDYTAPLKYTSHKHYDQLFNLNVYSFVELVKGLTQKNNHSSNGVSVVAVSSVMSIIPSPGLSAYAASKAAMDNLVKTFALEFAPVKIRFNTVLAAYVNTDMFKKLYKVMTDEQVNELISKIPLGLGDPIDVTNSIVFLLSNLAKWITGTNMVVDGGYLVRK